MANKHFANHIPSSERVVYIILSGIIVSYGTAGILHDDIYLPGKRGRGTHFHGEPAWLLYLSFLFLAMNLLSIVIDHYDKRNNQTNYKKFARITEGLAFVFFLLALVLDAFVFRKGT